MIASDGESRTQVCQPAMAFSISLNGTVMFQIDYCGFFCLCSRIIGKKTSPMHTRDSIILGIDPYPRDNILHSVNFPRFPYRLERTTTPSTKPSFFLPKLVILLRSCPGLHPSLQLASQLAFHAFPSLAINIPMPPQPIQLLRRL